MCNFWFLLLSGPDYVPFKVFSSVGKIKVRRIFAEHPWSSRGERSGAPSPVCVCPPHFLFCLSDAVTCLSPVGYSAVSVIIIIIIIRRIIGTPEAESPLELTDHHRVKSSAPPSSALLHLSVRYTHLQEAFSPLILPMKFPISPAHTAQIPASPRISS